GSDVHVICGPPGTGKTKTIGFLVAALIRRGLRVLIASHTNIATDHAITNVANLLRDSEDYQTGKLVRLGNISPNAEPPDMVIPDKIADQLGKQLKAALLKLQQDLLGVQSELSALREIEELLKRKQELQQKIDALKVSLQKNRREQEQTASLIASLATDIQAAQTRLEQALNAGKFKRFIYGLNPNMSRLRVIDLETQLATARQTIIASTSKFNELLTEIEI